MSLNDRGKMAAAEIGFYAPIAGLSIFLVVRYALRRDAGWLFLSLFSLAKIAHGALLVAGQLKPDEDALTAAYILEPSALSLLLVATIGFLGMAGQHTYSEMPRVTTIFRIFALLCLVGLGLSIAGGILGSPVSPNNGSIGSILRKVAACVYAGIYILLVLAYFGTFSYRWHLRSYRRNLLWGIGIALPFLGARVAYGVLVAWSSSDIYGQTVPSNQTLARMNPVTGDWILYLVLGLVVEWVAAAMFLFASTVMARRYH